MESGLALYNALVKINVPNDHARDVVLALEREMFSTLAAKTDLHGLASKTDLLGLFSKADLAELRRDIFEEFARLEAKFESKFATKNELVAQRELLEAKLATLETRLTVKLGSMMAASVGIMATLLVLLRR